MSGRNGWRRILERDTAFFVAGVASVVVAVVALFSGHGGSTTTALATAGMAMLGLLYVAPRLLTLRMGGVEVVLEKYAAEARQAEVAGDSDRAEELRQIASDVLEVYLSRSPATAPDRSGFRSQMSSDVFDDNLRASLPAGCEVGVQPLMSLGAESNIILRPDYLLAWHGRRAAVEYSSVLTEEFRHRLRRQARAFARMSPRPAMIVVVGGPKAVSRRLQSELDALNLPVWIRVISWRPGDNALELRMAIEEALSSRINS